MVCYTALYNPVFKKAAKRADPFWHTLKWKQYKDDKGGSSYSRAFWQLCQLPNWLTSKLIKELNLALAQCNSLFKGINNQLLNA